MIGDRVNWKNLEEGWNRNLFESFENMGYNAKFM